VYTIFTQMKKYGLFLLLLMLTFSSFSQDAAELIDKVKHKLDQVNDYKAEGKLKTDVAFLKVPVSKVNIYYKKPNRFRIKKDGGISLLPKGGVSINLNSLLTNGQFVAVPAGDVTINGTILKVVKLLPLAENSDVILTTIYIDEKSLLIRKATTTTRENGTYEMEMQYGKFGDLGLPDKVVFSFNTKDYKLPKGITFEYDNGEKSHNTDDKLKNKKGRVEITYNSYAVNQGLGDEVFQ
jgi:outer membrane lipoprotein-sorting protein